LLGRGLNKKGGKKYIFKVMGMDTDIKKENHSIMKY
jgi:hypothetical protein